MAILRTYANVAVHTTGINWQSIGVIAGIVGIAVTITLFMIARRDRKTDARNDLIQKQAEQRNIEIKNEITTAVDHLSEVLIAKLETKETVAKISERLARLEGSRGYGDQ